MEVSGGGGGGATGSSRQLKATYKKAPFVPDPRVEKMF